MNTSGSKDFLRKPRKWISKRKKTGQGYFYNSHNCNFINRNSSLQTNSAGYSEYVFQNPNIRPYNLRIHPGRTNSGYLKHIHSQSIRREKEHSSMGCYEEYTLKKIRTASDMIKQQLMSPEHPTITTNQINTGSDDTTSISKNKPHRLNGVGSKISDSNNEYSLTKLKRKPTKTSEEVTRLQLKQRRKNELREKFKKDNISRLKTSENYTAKEISDLILKHISKLNNDRILDFLNSDDSRYGDAFNYICKQKSFEVTKALRDLSHQEKPEACEIVNSIIPDFSIKIEELPINIIKELSLTFDELHKNIGDSCFSEENMHLYNGDSDLPTSDGLSVFLQHIRNDEINGKNFNSSAMKIDVRNYEICNNQDTIQNAEKSENTIEVLDSDEEISPSKETAIISSTHLSTLHRSNSTEKVVDSLETIAAEYVSSSNHSVVLKSDIGGINFPNIVPPEEIYGNTVCSNEAIITEINQSFSVLPILSENSIADTILSINPLQNNDNDTDEIVKNVADSTYSPMLDSIKGEMDSQDPLVMTDYNLLPKVGSVWVSKNIFETSNDLSRPENHEFEKSDESNIENSSEKINDPLNNLTSATEQYLEPTSVLIEQSSKILENTDLVQRDSNELNIFNAAPGSAENFEPYSPSVEISPKILGIMNPAQRQNEELEMPDVSNSQSSTLQHSSSEGDNLMDTSLILPLAINNSFKHVTEVNEEKFGMNDINKEESGNKVIHAPISNLNESVSIINRNPSDLPEFDSSDLTSVNSIATSEIIPTRANSDKFVSLTIKKFDKPKNLKDAINFMMEIDKHIEVLTKLRQDIFIGLGENVTETETVDSKSKKRKLEEAVPSQENAKKSSGTETVASKSKERRLGETVKSQENAKKSSEKETVSLKINESKLDKSVKSQENSKKASENKLPITKRTIKHSNPKPFESLNYVGGVVLFCKIIYDKGECIVGTDNGKIQYHSIYGNNPLMTVGIGSSAISFLECVRINERCFIFTGNSTELELKILKYKKKFIEKKIFLEDSIQTVKNEWGYFFIGGKRGYLTRYDWRKDRIQYEDRISTSCIKDMKTTREGPRKILLILFEDAEGEAHIHVRDAMTALHIRTIIDMKNVRCMFVRYSSVYLITDEQISVYNFCFTNWQQCLLLLLGLRYYSSIKPNFVHIVFILWFVSALKIRHFAVAIVIYQAGRLNVAAVNIGGPQSTDASENAIFNFSFNVQENDFVQFYKDGNFIRKVTTQQTFSGLKSKGNLLILKGTNGIYAFNMKNNNYLGCLQGEISASSLVIYEQKIICCTLSRKVEYIDLPDLCKDIVENK